MWSETSHIQGCKVAFCCLSFLLICLGSCQTKLNGGVSSDDLPQILERKELRAITLEGSMSYFWDGDEQAGYEYDLCRDYADHLGVPLKFIVANDLEDMRQLLLSGAGDIIAYRMPMSGKNKNMFLFSDNRQLTAPVLIQPLGGTITDVTGLIGKDIYTKKYSRYWTLLNNLNEELGGGINIHEVDSLSMDQLIRKVAEGEITLTVADREIAMMNRKYVPNINCHVELGLEQEYGWAVRKTSPELLASINEWYLKNRRYYKKIRDAYFVKNQYFEDLSYKKIGAVSPYDSIFKKYAPLLGWDWRLLASVAYHESRFNPQTVSYAGAVGLMQLMPITAERFGLDSVSVFDPDKNVEASVGYIKFLNKSFRFIGDEHERLKFILASYNSGPAHIFDAMALAKKYGKNSEVWNHSVEDYLMLKSQPEYYGDAVCKYGYFRANHTVRYVSDVLKTYNDYCGIKN